MCVCAVVGTLCFGTKTSPHGHVQSLRGTPKTICKDSMSVILSLP